MKVENKKYVFDNEQEKELFYDLCDYLSKEYKGKRALKRLVKNIDWFMNAGRGGFFEGFVFDMQGTLSCWGIYTGGKDANKDAEYKNFMQNHCEEFMKTKEKNGNLVCYALAAVFNNLVEQMKAYDLVSVK